MYRPSILHCALMGLMAAGPAVSLAAPDDSNGWSCTEREGGWHCTALELPTSEPAAAPAPTMTPVPGAPRVEEPVRLAVPAPADPELTDPESAKPADESPTEAPGPTADNVSPHEALPTPGPETVDAESNGDSALESNPAEVPEVASEDDEPPLGETLIPGTSEEDATTEQADNNDPEPVGNEDLTAPLMDLNDPNFANRALYPIDDAGLRKWRNCAALTFTPIALPRERGLGSDSATQAEADNLATFNDLEGAPVVLTGEAIAVQSKDLTRADRIIVRDDPSRIDTLGNVRMSREMLSLESDRGYLYTASDQGIHENATYYLPKNHARGTTSQLTLDGPYLRYLENGTFTTCDPDSGIWHVETTRFDLDFEEGVGTAENATLYIWDIPILYSPIITMPIDNRRRTGFITPSWVTSKINGYGAIIPYYLNLSENYDATVSARYMSERGTMAVGEFRYKTPNHVGLVTAEYLGDDTITEDDRHYMTWSHTASLAPDLTGDIKFQEISDTEYFNEFGGNLFSTSRNARYLERKAVATYTDDDWKLVGTLRNWQVVDQKQNPAGLPYNSYPGVIMNGHWPQALGDFDFAMVGRFDHYARDSRLHGTRIHATPSIIYPWVNPWGLISARADLFTTAYQLENLNGTVIRDPSVVAPMFSVDSTVIFERDYEWGEDSRLTHTIEPQAKLTYIPWADHSNLPVFDSNVPQATRANLKRINRFTGADRVGDTFKLAAGFDTRILDAGGIQRIKLGSTQVFYFDDRSVQRSARAFQDGTEYSEIATDFVMDLNDQWAADGELVWDPDRGDTVANRFDIRYRRDVDHVFDIGYRYRRRSFEHITASTRWLLTPGWTLFAGFDYSPRNDDFIDNIFGIEYDDCCLTVRVAFRDYKLLPQASAQNDEESEISLGIQIELKGFNFVGTNLEAEQMERIPGVRSYDL